MKKLLCFVLVLFLIPSVAFADTISDLKSTLEKCSYDQLVALNRVIQLYIFKKSIISDPNGVVVPAGEGYIVGVDIPAGTYRVVLPGLSAYEICMIDIDFHDGGYTHSHLLMSDGSKEIGKLELKDGATVNIISGPIRLFPYTGLFH